VNILTAMAENESVVKNESDGERRVIALAWLFHLVGDIHQPLHTTQLFTVDYPRVIEAVIKSASGRLQRGNPWTCTNFGTGSSHQARI